jgi:outer membrane protein OmpA-like peptidoglycan-associated protein
MRAFALRVARAASLLAIPAVAAATSCAGPARENGRIAGLEKTIEQAKANGALRCAPRELALAESHARFAKLELEQGFVSRADEHLAIAIPNAHAAFDNSPAEKCSDRGVVIAKPVVVPKPGDRDGDGFKDPDDKCPDVPENFNGFQDDDGCPDDPDSDGDGIADSRDSCPTLPEDKDGYLDDDGCPDPDNDGDGILDKVDKCPDQAEDPDGYEDGDGCPEDDNDKDGVVDLEDMCPLDPGPKDGNPKGCPKKPSIVVVTTSQIKITQQIHFEFNKATIKADSFPILNAVAQVLKENPDITLEIGGHTDNIGGDGYNDKLSQERAESVRKYLIDKGGISGSRLTAKGYGQRKPIDTNANEAGRAKNRRVEFMRTEGGKAP